MRTTSCPLPNLSTAKHKTGPKWPVSFPVDANLKHKDNIQIRLSAKHYHDCCLAFNSLAQVPHAHSTASCSVEKGTGRVEGDLIDLTLPWWDWKTPDRGSGVTWTHLAWWANTHTNTHTQVFILTSLKELELKMIQIRHTWVFGHIWRSPVCPRL